MWFENCEMTAFALAVIVRLVLRVDTAVCLQDSFMLYINISVLSVIQNW